jgi:DNA polymerase II large subunit
MIPDIKAYSARLETDVRASYELAKRARSKGFDVTDRVEIPLATDMAERIEELIQIDGLAEMIRETSKTMSREESSIWVARQVAKNFLPQGKKIALDKAVRVGLAILTEGILVAPLEGIADVSVLPNDDGTEFAAIVYSGPIRGAGGTAQAMSVLIADVVRRDLGIGSFTATEDEIQRYTEEIDHYNRIKHLQYLPSPDEIRLVVSRSPVMIDGEGSEEEEVSGHRNMTRIKSNRIRGGMCLVISEGLIQKSKKILKHTSALSLHEWDFLSMISGQKNEDSGELMQKSEKFLKDIIAGRPVFSHPSRPGGFRLRYGRSRTSGLAAASINPASMIILGGFIAIGSQIKVELPGKAAAITPCDSIEGPMVLLDDGRHIRVNSIEDANAALDHIVQITDVGEILISFGDFAENNHKLEKSPFTEEWWNILARKIPDPQIHDGKVSSRNAFEISRKYGLPLHPAFLYFWHDITNDDLKFLAIETAAGMSAGHLRFRKADRIFDILIKLGAPFSTESDIWVVPHDPDIFIQTLGLDRSTVDDIILRIDEGKTVVENLSMLSGVKIMERSPTRIGARMGRPEKSGDRKMKPKVHVLFPVESYGDNRRSIIMAEGRASDGYESEVASRRCPKCGNITPVPICEECGQPTIFAESKKMSQINLQKLISSAENNIKISLSDIKEFKGVKKLMSDKKACEPLEKGMLRSLHDVSINKDGTCRYDMSDIPLTHFTPEEIGTSIQKLHELGYEGEKEFELFPQDVIIPADAARYMLRVSQFIDHLLVSYYRMEPYYSCKDPEDLIGHLVIGLAPHTSGGIVGRIIGISHVSGCYAHPLFHAAKRRNCDGDEDSIMLLLDGLLNFSRWFLPSTRGGLMDAPLVLTLHLKADEVDKEAMNLDTLSEYPEEFYKAAGDEKMPSTIEGIMVSLKKYEAENGTVMGIGYTHHTRNINDGVTVSAYKTIGSMQEKIEKQLGLAEIIRAVDENDVAARVLNSHFLPDIYGNFRAFFSQEFRCTKCNTKYRRIPLSGKCRKCGNNSINLTIHKASIVKYLEETIRVSDKYNMPDYLKARIANLARTITGTFAEDKEDTLETYEDAL